ncbi:MAG: DUF952 domain-containing protein [Micromonosporaceae bacterium]
MIYKLLVAAEWDAAQAAGEYAGSAVDRADGFIHLSAADQVVETARRHFAHVTGAHATGLVLLAVDPDRLGPALRWEASRGGALFPHLYAPLSASAVVASTLLADDIAPADAVAAVLRH